MPTKDFNKEISVATTLSPNIVKTTTTGTAVDLLGFNKVALVATIGTITDGTYAFVIADSPDNSTWTTVSASYLSGSFANATSAADDTVQEVGYLGTQRYVRVSVTVTGSPADGGPIAVSVIRAGARTLPQ